MSTLSADAFPSRRLINTLGLLICVGLLGYAYYLQFYQGQEPCPLCIFQRLAYVGLAIVFLVAALHNPRAWGSRVYAVLLLLIAAIGTAIAARQVWLQSLPPDQVPSCGPGLNYLLSTLPLSTAITKVLRGSGECAAVTWRFLGLSIAGWSLIWFVLLGLVGAVRNWQSR